VFFGELSFGQNQISNGKTAVIFRSESCPSNKINSYQIFVPSVDTSFRQIPLLIAFAPNGDANLAINWFKETAEKYQIIVASSSTISTADSSSLLLLDEMIADIRTKFHAGNYLFIGGSPLGTNLGMNYSLKNKVDGIISMGMIIPPEKISQLKTRVWKVVFPEDLNFVDIAPLIIDPHQMPSNLLLELADSFNEESQKMMMQQMLTYLLVSTMPPGTPDEKKKIVQDYTAEQKNRIDHLLKTGKYLQAALIARNMYQFHYFEREFSFISFFDQLTNDPNYQNQNDKLSKSIQFETAVRNDFYNNILTKDSTFWQQDIDLINSKIETEKDKFMLSAYKRIKGFLGIFCYSMCEHFADVKDAQNLEKALSVYQMAEPKNHEVQNFMKKLKQLKERK